MSWKITAAKILHHSQVAGDFRVFIVRCFIYKRCVNTSIQFNVSTIAQITIDKELKYKRVGLLGVPYEKGQKKPGTSKGPGSVREKHLVDQIEQYGIKVEDFGDIHADNISKDYEIYNARFPRTFLDNTKKVSQKVQEIIEKGNLALTIGGDHSIGVGTVQGHAKARGNISIIWVDAHADINTPLSSSSGNMHGMPLSFSIHEMKDERPVIDEFKDIKPVISAKHVTYIGLRDVDPYERYVLNKYNIKAFSMEDVDKFGIDSMIQQAIKAVNPNLDRSIHLSFDVDGMDPLYAPSTGTKVPGGLTLREGIHICEQLSYTGKLGAVDIVEINPELGTETDAATTVNSAIRLILGCLGVGRKGVPMIDPNNYSWKDKK